MVSIVLLWAPAPRLDSGGMPRPFVNKSIQQSVVRGMR